MADLNDERVRFYLRHREQIETWASLRAEAGLAIDALLEQLADDVNALCAELGEDVLVRAQLEGNSYPQFLLHRAGWGLNREAPEAAVGLEWLRGKTFLDGMASPYVGVRFDISDEQTRLRRNRFRDAAQDMRAQRADKATPWWPCLSYIPAKATFLEDIGPYREHLLGSLRAAWDAYANTLEAVIVPV